VTVTPVPSVPTVTRDTERAFHCSYSTADSGPDHAADCSTDRATNPIAFAMALSGALLNALDEALGMAGARHCREGQDDSRCTEHLDANPLHLAHLSTSMIVADSCRRNGYCGGIVAPHD